MIEYKKAQIGKTMTWFVAFIIIIFIMLLFISASLIFSNKNKILTSSSNSEVLKNQIELNNFLNKQVQIETEKLTIYDLIIKSNENSKYSSKLNEEAALFVKNLNSDCYVFILNDRRYADISKSDNLYAVSNTLSYQDILLDTQGIKMILLSGDGKDTKKIEIKFYAGGC
ncbi:MAG: hypothetical protein Q7S33_05920 [Nanoarchaeota archaeon]|nr:hypothetical protein [Nanoarchaeota archaeon]